MPVSIAAPGMSGILGPKMDSPSTLGKSEPQMMIEQQKGLEALAKVAVEKFMASVVPEHAHDTVHDVVVIGRGSSAAAFVRNLEGVEDKDVLVIGKSDPWRGARGHDDGHYTKNINQAEQLIDLGEGAVASRSTDPVDRLDKADLNEVAIWSRIGGENLLDGTVAQVARAGDHYVVRTDDGREIHSKKVVYATGAGIEDPAEVGADGDHDYHYIPGEVRAFRTTVDGMHPAPAGLRDRVMDLDTFQQDPVRFTGAEGQRVVVLGANAGTDAIMEAATREFEADNVFWMMGPNHVPGTALTWDVAEVGIDPSFTVGDAVEEREARLAQGRDGGVVRFVDYTLTPTLNDGGAPLRVTYHFEVTHEDGSIETRERRMDADYFVYAAGQRGDVAGATLTPELRGELEVAYDKDQRFTTRATVIGDDGFAGAHAGGAHQHATGLQTRGATAERGIEIVGAAASQGARNVQHSFLNTDYEGALAKAREDPAFDAVADFVFPGLTRDVSFVGDVMAQFAGGALPERLTDEDYRRLEDALLDAVEERRAGMGDEGAVVDRQGTAAAMKDLLNMHRMRDRAAREYSALGNRNGGVAAILSAGLSRTTPATTGDARLIGGLNRNIEAGAGVLRTDHISDPSRHGLNFLEDQTTMAVFVAEHYLDIPGSMADNLVSWVINMRTDGHHLRGFNAEELTMIEGVLDDMNADFAERRDDFLAIVSGGYDNIPDDHAARLADELTHEFGKLDVGGTFGPHQQVAIMERLRMIDDLYIDAGGAGGAGLDMAQSGAIGRLDHIP